MKHNATHWVWIRPPRFKMDTLARPLHNKAHPLPLDLAMTIHLDPIQARILGALVEKDLTTPDYYPLSLHALVNACNQKSNREPVMDLDESTVQTGLDALIKQNLAAPRSEFGSRVAKYAHKLAGTATRLIDFSPPELAVMCELLLRGPQTPGELRARAGRMHPFGDITEVERTLKGLMNREGDPYVAELPRQPGRREIRYVCLFVENAEKLAGESIAAVVTPPSAAPLGRDYEERLRILEERVVLLMKEMQELRNRGMV